MANKFYGTALAAGAISSALNDYFKGQMENQVRIPQMQAQAEEANRKRMQDSAAIAKLPWEAARERQQMTLGDLQIAEHEGNIKLQPYKLQEVQGKVADAELERTTSAEQKRLLDQFHQQLDSMITLNGGKFDTSPPFVQAVEGLVAKYSAVVPKDHNVFAILKNHLEWDKIHKDAAIKHPFEISNLPEDKRTPEQKRLLKQWEEGNAAVIAQRNAAAEASKALGKQRLSREDAAVATAKERQLNRELNELKDLRGKWILADSATRKKLVNSRTNQPWTLELIDSHIRATQQKQQDLVKMLEDHKRASQATTMPSGIIIEPIPPTVP